MSSMTFGQKKFIPTPPDKGSFPLDHDGVCKKLMLKYMLCLRNSKNLNSKCKQEIKDYLGCRMDNNLMTKEDWGNLGFSYFSLLNKMDELLKKYLPQIKNVPVEDLHKAIDSMSREDVPRIVYESHPELYKYINNITILVCCTGSVATIKLSELITQLKKIKNVNIIVVLTERAKHFCISENPLNCKTYTDHEWELSEYKLHEELANNANILLIAPLSANSLAKIANGICDNLLTSIVRGWDFNNKIAISCPAMNTQMWSHPITEIHMKQVQDLGFSIIQPITKKLACGDYGIGAMAEPHTIASAVEKFADFEGNKKWYEAYMSSLEKTRSSIASRLSDVHF